MAHRVERDAAPRVARPGSLFETEPLSGIQPAQLQQAAWKRRNDEDLGRDFRSFNFHPTLEELPEESALTVEINGRPAARLLCTPQATRELAVGWAFAHGFLDEAGAIRRISEVRDRVSVMVEDGSEGGRHWTALVASGFDASLLRVPEDPRQIQARAEEDGVLPSRWTIPRGKFLVTVARIFERFRAERGLGGYHHAGAGDGDRVCIVSRDVSRHNAVDKVVGWSILHRVSRSDLILCLSGRVTADITYKAWRAGFPVIAASGWPTADAVDLAEAAGISLVGQALDGRRAVFSHGWRLTLDDE